MCTVLLKNVLSFWNFNISFSYKNTDRKPLHRELTQVTEVWILKTKKLSTVKTLTGETLCGVGWGVLYITIFVFIQSFLYFITSGILTCRLILNIYILSLFFKNFRVCVFGIYIIKFACEVCWCVCVCVTCLVSCVLGLAVSPEEGGSLLKKRSMLFSVLL